MFVENYIENKAEEFYMSNIEQFFRDIYNLNATFESYMEQDRYFKRYINNQIHYDRTDLEKYVESEKEDLPYLTVKNTTRFVKSETYLKIKSLFAQGLAEEIMRINLELLDEDTPILIERKRKLFDELKRILEI